MSSQRNCKVRFMFVTSALLLIAGLTLCFCNELIFSSLLKRILTLKPNNHLFAIWKRSPLAISMNFYFFNWTNPEAINDATIKPNFEQIGPYTFVEDKEKVNLTWNRNGTVTFKQLRRWYFVEDMSRDLTDPITTLNAVSLSAAHKVSTWSYLMRKGFSATLSTLKCGVHVTKTAGQLLFDGYDDELLDMARSMPFLADQGIPNYDKFGWFYMRNGSYTFDGTLQMRTGDGGDATLGELVQWNYKNRTRYFAGGCGKVHGSAGELFPPAVDSDRLSIFSTDMCQNVPLEFSERATVLGVPGRKYEIGSGLLDNGTLLPANACFCNGECVPSGTVNVSACRYGSPAFMSLPHFHKADPYYLRHVDGLAPNASHSFHLTLEPRTGIPLEVAARLQLNLLLRPVKDVALYENVKRTFMPVLWFEQAVTLSDEMAQQVNLLLLLPLLLRIGGIVAIVVAIGLYLRGKYLRAFKGEHALIHRDRLLDFVMDGMYS